MSESSRTNEPGAEKRRSTRLAKSVPIKISGTDALGQAFQETTATVMIDCYGCKYQSRHYVPKNSIVSVEVRRPELRLPARIAQARVVWVQRPKTYREIYHVALALEVPGNVWGIPWPPSDWFPCPGEEGIAVVEEVTTPELMAATAAASPLKDSSRGWAERLAVADEVVLDCTVEMMTALEKSKNRTQAAGEGARATQLAAIQQVARLAVAEALCEQTAEMRRELDAAIRYVVEQNAERVTAQLEATRKELAALREAVNAQPGRRGQGLSGKRRTREPTLDPK